MLNTLQDGPPPPPQQQRIDELFLASQMGGGSLPGSNATPASVAMPPHLQIQNGDASFWPGRGDGVLPYASSLSVLGKLHPAILNDSAQVTHHSGLLAPAPHLNGRLDAGDVLKIAPSTLHTTGAHGLPSLQGTQKEIPSLLSAHASAANAHLPHAANGNTLTPSTIHGLGFRGLNPMQGLKYIPSQPQCQQTFIANPKSIMYVPPKNNLPQISDGSAAAIVGLNQTETNSMGSASIQNPRLNSFIPLQAPAAATASPRDQIISDGTAAALVGFNPASLISDGTAAAIVGLNQAEIKLYGPAKNNLPEMSDGAAAAIVGLNQTHTNSMGSVSIQNPRLDSFVPLQAANAATASPQDQLQQAGSDNTLGSSTMPSLGDQIAEILPNAAAATNAEHPYQGAVRNVTSLFIQADIRFLDPVHLFLRSQCIDVFVVTKGDMTATGRGARPTMIGQVGLRCRFCRELPKNKLAKQAICFPSKRQNIFESVRNYQRTHFRACTHISEEMKDNYKSLTEQGSIRRRSQKYLKAFYAEAASEIGIVNTPNGLMFGAPPNMSGVPSVRLQALIDASENPSLSSSFWRAYSSGQDKAAEMRKFEHVASASTRRVIVDARKEPTPFVRPEDFLTVSDFEFVLFHQVCPSAPPAALMKQKGLDTLEVSKFFGFSCKHCDRAGGSANSSRGMHFPANTNVIADTSFIQKMLSHFMSCPNVPQEVKDAFDELKRLAAERGTMSKRGSRKRFIEKVWERMKKHYGLQSDPTFGIA